MVKRSCSEYQNNNFPGLRAISYIPASSLNPLRANQRIEVVPKALIRAPMLFTTVVQKLNQGEGRNRVLHRFRPCFFGSFLQEQKRTEKEIVLCSSLIIDAGALIFIIPQVLLRLRRIRMTIR